MRFVPIILFFIFTLSAKSADWVEIPLDEDSYVLYIDTETTVANEPFVEFWLKLEHNNLQKIPDSNMKFDKVLFHFLISCEDKAQALDQEKYFREGVLVKSIRVVPEELTWKPVEPETTNELLMKKYCANNTGTEEKKE